MLQSMTGFVSYEIEIQDYQVIWEVRTLNHRFLDMTLKLPESLRCTEFDLRNLAKKYIRRGKVDISLYLKSKTIKDCFKVSDDRLIEVAEAFQRAKGIFVEHDVPVKVNLVELFANSNLIGQDNKSVCETLKAEVVNSFETVLQMLIKARTDEGERLKLNLENCLCTMKQITAEIYQQTLQTKEQAYKKLQQKAKELATSVNVDSFRLEQEVVLLAQKADIQEELDRLNSHYCEISSLLSSESLVGRKLDFLMQELNRESNTICSKSVDINIINSAVNLKTYIEQMREQIQNIE